jgi:hypothetical protein
MKEVELCDSEENQEMHTELSTYSFKMYNV